MKQTIPVNVRSFGRYVGYLSNGMKIDQAMEEASNVLGLGSWQVEKWFTEPNPKRRHYKPELDKAIEMAIERKATMIVPKMTHLLMNVVFVEKCYIASKDHDVEILGCDVMGSKAIQWQLLYNIVLNRTEKTSQSVKQKMRQLKLDGVKLGAPDLTLARAKASASRREKAKDNARMLLPQIKQIQKDGNHSLTSIADQLNKRKIPSPRGGEWYATSVRNLLKLQKGMK